MARASKQGKPAPPKPQNGANLGFEAKLWAAADALRNNVDAAEHPRLRSGELRVKDAEKFAGAVA